MSSQIALPRQAYPVAGYPRRNIAPPLSLAKLGDSITLKETGPFTGGLRTPPAEDDMSTAYHSSMVASHTYNNHVALARHPNLLLPPSRVNANAAVFDAAVSSHSRSQTQIQTQSNQPSAISYSVRPQPSSGSSRALSLSHVPTAADVLQNHGGDEVAPNGEDSIMITHSLKLPRCIAPNGGSLDDFAAQMTCFFWFETMDTIEGAEQISTRHQSEPLPLLSRHTEPCGSYKKWVHNILTTTQVTQNVVLLALLFVYRLKKTNPRVNGNPGSEYRLLTVALMLGNKFLDDNTYTNRTWAEVSNLSVKEIHVMEVEFLSNMRYSLLTSKEQWKEWLQKLACYHAYCERARAEEATRQAQIVPVHLPPNQGRFTPPLTSPTSVLHPDMHGPTALVAAYSPAPSPHTSWDSTYHPTPTVSPLASKPSLGHPMVRKRSREGSDAMEPAPKRSSRPPSQGMGSSMRQIPAATDLVRLPAPQLTLDTSHATLPNAYGAPNYSLPPLMSNIRAMSTVYQTSPSTWGQQAANLPACGPQTPSYSVPSNYGTPTKRHSPSNLAAYGSSPLAEVYASHTPISNSPSVYLQQRASPYKPVRRVHTLLNPPPSMPLSEYHLGSTQMHYQPIGRRHDLRTGIVPEFMSAYPQHQRPPIHPYQ